MKKLGLMLLAVIMVLTAIGAVAWAGLATLVPVHGMFYMIPDKTGKFTSQTTETCTVTKFLERYYGVNSGSLDPQNMATILMDWWDFKGISAVYFPYQRQAGDNVINVAYTTIAGLPACYLEYDFGEGDRVEHYILAAADGYFNINLYSHSEFLAEGAQVTEEFMESLVNQGKNKPDPDAARYVAGGGSGDGGGDGTGGNGSGSNSGNSGGGGGCDASGGLLGMLALAALTFARKSSR